MVDSTDLILVATVVQTVVITATLLVFIFQFRSQEKATKEAAVQNVMSHYTDFVRMLVEKPELGRLQQYVQSTAPPGEMRVENLSPEDQMLSAYILLGYGIFEEIFTLYKRKWISEGDWKQWENFLRRFCRHPLFRRAYLFSKGTFNPDFEAFVGGLLEEVPPLDPKS